VGITFHRSLDCGAIVEGQGKVFAEVLICRERYYIFATLCIAVDTVYYVKNASVYIYNARTSKMKQCS